MTNPTNSNDDISPDAVEKYSSIFNRLDALEAMAAEIMAGLEQAHLGLVAEMARRAEGLGSDHLAPLKLNAHELETITDALDAAESDHRTKGQVGGGAKTLYDRIMAEYPVVYGPWAEDGAN